jgi:gluconolactonase
MTIETLAFGYGLVEGPRCDADDNLYFSDVRNGGVYRRTPDGEITTVVPKRRGVGGIALHAEGGLVISGKNICHVRDGQTRLLFGPADVPGFNDLFCDAAGRVYTGSMRSDPFTATGPRTPGEAYRIDGEGSGALLYPGVSLTNGIGFSPDDKLLYHVDSAPRHILVHDVERDGSVGNRRVFAALGPGLTPDGLAVDEDGGVWVAVVDGGCVQRFAPDGAADMRVDVPAKFVTSLCFGGTDRRDLYIVTADNADEASRRGTIFRTRSPYPGTIVHPARV